ncbi:MAG: hypothetical protein K2X81_24350 [Candidatus Obscuribacterales bacterium]|jgi:hypothetical protein|nr:hypothetical protein [Candidatus Obscuribacterales bacterium]
MAGMIVRSGRVNPKAGPIEIWRVHKELQNKKIPKTVFAKALGISYEQLDGKGTFPVDKVEECWRLLERWGSQ